MRRSRAALAAACALVVLVTGGLVGPASGGTGDPGPPTVRLLSQPIAIAADGTFPTLISVADAPTATSVVVDIYDRVLPGEVVGVEPDGGPEATFEPILLEPSTTARTTGFTIALYTRGESNPDPAWGHRIDEPGVYPVRVRLQDDDGNRLAIMMTSLIRLPAADEQVPQTRAALLIPVHRPPPADPEERAATSGADASLLADLDPVLTALDGHGELPATIDATPDTIARISADAGAADVLRRLRTALDGDDRTLLDAPYVDIDAASLVAAGLPGELSRQADQGSRTLQDLLEPPVTGTWRLHDRLDEAAVAQLGRRGVARTILPGDALAGGAGVLAPVDLAASGQSVRAVAASAAFSLGPDAPNDPILAAHRLLGRLAATGPSPTGGPAGVVVTLDPGATTSASLQVLLDALQFQTPFFAAAPLEQVLGAAPDTGRTTLAPARPDDIGTYATAMLRARGALNSFEAMVGGRNELVRPYELTLAVSASRDLSDAQRTRDAASVVAALQEPFSAISVPADDTVTLGTRDASFPLPVESSLEYPVQVVIELQSSDRLEFPNNRIEATLRQGRQVVPISVRTRAPGATPVQITVRSPDDGVVLSQARYRIRSSAVSGVGVLLTFGAAAFLAVWWGRHWWRNRGTARHARRRRRRQADEDAPVEV